MGIIGNNSNIPYKKNECYLYSETGECFIYKGWAIITQTSNDFKCNVYDGNLEIYKAIENKTLSELDLTALQHNKTLAEVLSTFDNSKPYKYILADYNGKSMYSTNIINIDYLIPSVKASFLVEQIEMLTGFTLSGTYRNNPDFVNLFMTYPNGVTPTDLGTTDIFYSNNLEADIPTLHVITQSLMNELTISDAIGTTWQTTNFTSTQNNTVVIEITSQFMASAIDDYGVAYYTDAKLFMLKNAVQYFVGYVAGNNSPTLVTSTYQTTIDISDEISFYVDGYASGTTTITGSFSDIKIKKYNTAIISFTDVLKEFTIKDFLDEILWRFGLTLFKDKYLNKYEFKTLPEIIDTTVAIDWSDKFVSLNSEKYTYGSYAQRNYFKYKYTQTDAIYHDGYIDVSNDNLEDSKTVIQSKIYAPELSISLLLGFKSRVYKLWNKEPSEDGIIKYKDLSAHFYFIKSVNYTFPAPILIGSERLTNTNTIASAPIDSYKGLPFTEIIVNNYQDLKTIIQEAKLLSCSMWLKDEDIIDIDLSRTYYIKQLGGYFIINKINNFVPHTKTNVELIKVNKTISNRNYSSLHYSTQNYS